MNVLNCDLGNSKINQSVYCEILNINTDDVLLNEEYIAMMTSASA